MAWGVVIRVVAAAAFGSVVGAGVGTGVLFSREPFAGVPAAVPVGEGSVGVDWLLHAAKKRRATIESMGILRFNFRRCR